MLPSTSFSLSPSKTVPLLEIGLLVVTQVKIYVTWGTMGAVGLDSFVSLIEVDCANTFTDVISLF